MKLTVNTPVKSWQRYLTYMVCIFLNVQTAVANVVVSSGNTHVIKAGNGVEVVNIATPNGTGLSHNKYDQFNVDPSGLILNNSTEQLAQSKLGGILQNNPNLTNGAAKAILNEVTGTSPSQLMGYTEVFGSSAPVILTNQYGITCDGCGFINTPRVTLSTGSPLIENGQLSGFDVSQGSVTIEGLGLDGTNQTYFDIITRALELNAEIHANDLTVITGRNEVAYKTNEVLKEDDSITSKPELAIDSSFLGGMYAGRITLIATENGVGVNLGKVASSQGNITLSADGKITLGNVSSAQEMTVVSTDSLLLNGNQSAVSNISYDAQKVTTNSANISSAGKVTINANNSISVNDSSLVARDHIVLDTETLTLLGSNIESDSVNVSSNSVQLDSNSELVSQKTEFIDLTNIDNNGKIIASESLTFEGSSLNIRGTGNSNARNVNVKAEEVNLSSEVNSENLVVDAQKSVIINSEANLTATKEIHLASESIDQQGNISSRDAFTIAARTLTHSGTSLANEIEIEAQDSVLDGKIAGTNSIEVIASQVDIQGEISSSGTIIIASDTVNQKGNILASDTLSIDSQNIAHTGTSQAGNVDLSANLVELNGQVKAAELISVDATQASINADLMSSGSVSITSNELEIDGVLRVKENLSLLTNNAKLKGDIALGQSLAVDSGITEIDGLVRAGIDVVIDSTELETSNESVVVSGNDLTINTTLADLSGDLTAVNRIAIQGKDTSLSGLIKANDKITIDSDSLSLLGDLEGGSSAEIVANEFNQQGHITTNEALVIDADKIALNGDLTSLGDISIDGQTIEQSGDLYSAKNIAFSAKEISLNGNSLADVDLEVTADTLTHSGGLIANEKVNLNASSMIIQGQIAAKKSASLEADSLVLSGNVKSLGNIEVVTQNDFSASNLAEVNSLESISLSSDSIDNQGKWYAGRSLDINARDLTDNGEFAALNDLSIDVVQADLNRTIQAGNNLSLIVAGNLKTDNKLIAGNDLTVEATSLDNSSQLTSGNKTDITVTSEFNNRSGGVVSGLETQIGSGSLRNDGQLQALHNLGLDVSALRNHGSVAALNDMQISSDSYIYNYGLLYAGRDANVSLQSTLLNQQADILTGRHLTLKERSSGNSSLLRNRSGDIESGGNLFVNVDTLENTRMSISSTSSSTNHSSVPSSYTARSSATKSSCYGSSGGGGQGAGHGGGGQCTYTYSSRASEKLYRTDRVSVVANGASARLVSGGDMAIKANSVTNKASLMASNSNLTIDASSVRNEGYVDSIVEYYATYSSDSGAFSRQFAGSQTLPSTVYFDRLYTRTGNRTESSSAGSYSSTIQARKGLTIRASSKFNNSVQKAYAGASSVNNGSGNLKSTSSTNVSSKNLSVDGEGPKSQPSLSVDAPEVNVEGPLLEFTAENNVSFPEFRLPTNPNGLFFFSDDPKSNYVIETNPLVTDMGQFLGSDYFQDSVGFYPEQDMTFLGDAFYDTKMITQAIFEQTGQRYLSQSIGSDLEQMKQLIDAAGEQKQALELTVGIALTSEQIASLTEDMIWYEEVAINGRLVLAPKLYIAEVEERNFSQGAIIAGGEVNIEAGAISNSGSITSEGTMALSSDSTMRNMQGLIEAKGDLTLLAQDDIWNQSGQIRGNNVVVSSVSGDVVNETLFEQINIDATGNLSSLDSAAVTLTMVDSQANISALGSLTIDAANNLTNIAAGVDAGSDMALSAGNDLSMKTIEHVETYDIRTSEGRNVNKSVTHVGSLVSSGGGLTLTAGNDVQLVSAELDAQKSLNAVAGNNLSVEASQNELFQLEQGRNNKEIDHARKYVGSELSGQNVTLSAGKDLLLRGSSIAAENNVDMNAKGDINILAVNDSTYHYDETTKKKSFGRSETIINESLKETVVGSSIQAGANIDITAQKQISVATAGGDSDITLIGSSLDAGGSVNLTADGDITLAAQSYKEFERHETIKKGFAGLSGSHKGSVDDATLLNSSYLINSGDTNLTSGNNIGVIASEIVSDGNVNLEALDEVLVAAGDVLKQSQEWDEKTKFLSGGNLFELEKKRHGEETVTAQSSAVQSGGNLTIDAGSITVVGSDLAAEGNVELIADTGSVEILAAKETTKTFESEEKLAISMGDGFNGVSVEDGQIKISLGDATYDKVKQQSDSLNHEGSVIAAGDNLSVDAESSILVEGSTLVADSNQDQSGDLTLAAKDNVTIKEAVDTLSEQREEIHGKAEASLVVQHQAVEVAKAAQALKQSTKKLKQAEQDYKQYKKGLDSLESTLSTLEQEYADKKPGVTFEDIEELNDLISEVKSDEAWYVAGVALAAEDVVSKTTLLYQQNAALVNSVSSCPYCFGFNAGLQLDIEASQTESQTQSTTSVASNLSGQNISINAGRQEGNQIDIQGSTLFAQDALELSANEINITASKNTHNSKTDHKSGSVSASVTVFGATSGANLNASLSRNQNTSSSITHNNSQLNGRNVTLISDQDTNIKGGSVDAGEQLTIEVGGNLNVASVQDRQSSNHKGQSISGGMSFSSGDAPKEKKSLADGFYDPSEIGDLSGGSSGFNASNGRTSSKQTVVTSLTSNGSLDINVGGNTDIKGATIAALDEEGKDSGKLNLTTGSLTYADLSNTSYSQDQSLGLNTSVGVNNGELDSTNNSTSLQYKNTSGYDKSKTLATLGQGNLNIGDLESSDDTSRLNRDIDQTEKELFTVDRKQGDIDVTIDHRLLTEDGRKAIAKDVETTHEAGQDVYRAAETYANSDDMDLFDFGKSVSDNRKVTELKNDLLSSKEGIDLLNDLKSSDPDKVLAAQAEISKKAQEKYGLEPEQVNFYNADKTTSVAMTDNDVRDVHGGVVTDDDHEMHGEVNVDVSDATTKTELLNTLGHETYESITESTTGEQTAAQEDLAKSFGNQLEDRVNQAAGGDLDSTVDGNWNSSLVNSSTAQLGTEKVNKVGNANVDYYLTQTEAQRKDELKHFIERCTDFSCRNTDEYKSKQKELASLIKEDDQRDLDYKKACYSGGGEECNSESAKVVAAHDTWDKETAVKDSSLTSEYIDLTSKNAEAEARPWELAAGSALAEMPTDMLIGAISAVPEMVDLATTATAAVQGDEGAQQQLKAMYESAVETMSDPNGAADKYITDIQAKEARGEISSFEAKKQISKFYISITAVAASSAYGLTELGSTAANKIVKLSEAEYVGGTDVLTDIKGHSDEGVNTSQVDTEFGPRPYGTAVTNKLDFDTILHDNNISLNKGWSVERLYDEVLSAPHGSRPEPSSYLSQQQIDIHMSTFDEGAVRFTSRSGIREYGTVGPDGGFVLPRSEFDKVLSESKGDLRIVERKLGLDNGYLGESDTIAVYIRPEDMKNIRIPTGNEAGANSQWVPGGYTNGGVPEAVMDFSHKPRVTELSLK